MTLFEWLGVINLLKHPNYHTSNMVTLSWVKTDKDIEQQTLYLHMQYECNTNLFKQKKTQTNKTNSLANIENRSELRSSLIEDLSIHINEVTRS